MCLLICDCPVTAIPPLSRQLAFFRMDESLMKIYFSTFEEFFRENLPKLCQHFTEMTFLPEMYLLDWIFTIFCKVRVS